jgi:UDP-3-O-[3-hydroxymyristoyl] glucosamine N-acyltransferase
MLGAEAPAGAELTVVGLSTPDAAGPDDLVFAESEKYLDALSASQALAAIVPPGFPDLPGKTLLRVARPRLAFLRVAERFVQTSGGGGVHPDASVHPDAELGPGVSVGPCAVIGAGARIGANCHIAAGAYVGEGVHLGEDCVIEPNASLLHDVRLGDRVIIHANASIGGDGFGYAWLEDHHHKIPQLGTVEIGDDVEIGCNSCVDRAALGVTRIGRGSKLDNLVHVAHNCELGEHVVLAGQSGMGGSVTIGSGVVAGGHAAFTDHIEVGAGAKISGKSGVTKNVEPGETLAGFPARPVKQAWKEQAAVSKLPDLLKEFRKMRAQIEALSTQVEALSGRGG